MGTDRKLGYKWKQSEDKKADRGTHIIRPKMKTVRK